MASLVAPVRRPDEQRSSGGKWLVAAVLGIVLLLAVTYKMGKLDSLLATVTNSVKVVADVDSSEQATVSGPVDDLDKAVSAKLATEQLPENNILEPDLESVVDDPPPALVDYSTLPPATVVIPIHGWAGSPARVAITLREDSVPAVLEFVRDGNLDAPLTLRLEEVGFSGNYSPWATGQYSYSGDGIVHFPVGQNRARVSLRMANDLQREADQLSNLRLRDIDFPASVFAVLEVHLIDDDQRRFESSLPPNTVAFAASHVSVRERDPAVQIDLIRFNPSDAPTTIGFQVIDMTATEGSDYFAPNDVTITFGPGQRTARILIPLVQDAEMEEIETFVIELLGVPTLSAVDVHRRVAVIIRDN
jgi:hypothetical protein